jgi:hypothetical protein
MSGSKRSQTPVKGTGMPGAGMHSESEFEKDPKKDLLSEMESAEETEEPEKGRGKIQPTPRKAKQARKGNSPDPDSDPEKGMETDVSDKGTEEKKSDRKEKAKTASGEQGERSKDRAAKDKPMPTAATASASASSSAAAASAAAEPTSASASAQQQNVAQASRMLVNMEMLGKMNTMFEEKFNDLTAEVMRHQMKLREQANKISDLQRSATVTMVEKREEQDKETAKTYDVVGIPKTATESEKKDYIAWILAQVGMTSNSYRHIEIMGADKYGSGMTETWRFHFKDYTAKRDMHEWFRKNWNLHFWGRTGYWMNHEIKGRWTEGYISRVVRDSINVVWRTMREVLGNELVFGDTGYEIDYRMCGIFKKQDRAPSAIFIYSEHDADPRIKIYSNCPDDYDQDDWEKAIEERFQEEQDKMNFRTENKGKGKEKGKEEGGKGQTVPKVPHETAYKKKAYSRSYKMLRDLNTDHPDFLTALTNHAVETTIRRESKGKGNKGKGKGMKGKDKGEGGKGEGFKGKDKGKYKGEGGKGTEQEERRQMGPPEAASAAYPPYPTSGKGTYAGLFGSGESEWNTPGGQWNWGRW